jgi:hypothetical protein
MTASYSKLFLLLTTISFMLAACNTVCSTKKVGCPGFSDANFSTWFPYQNNQLLVFKNVNGDSLKYTVSDIEPSGRYDAIVGGLFRRSATSCSTSIYVTARPDSIYQPIFLVQYYVDTPFSGQDVTKNLYIAVDQANWSVGAIYRDSIGIAINSYNSTSKPSINYNVRLYNGQLIDTLVTLTNDTTLDHSNKFYKAFIQKGKGIIGFEMYPNHQQWLLQ